MLGPACAPGDQDLSPAQPGLDPNRRSAESLRESRQWPCPSLCDWLSNGPPYGEDSGPLGEHMGPGTHASGLWGG